MSQIRSVGTTFDREIDRTPILVHERRVWLRRFSGQHQRNFANQLFVVEIGAKSDSISGPREPMPQKHPPEPLRRSPKLRPLVQHQKR